MFALSPGFLGAVAADSFDNHTTNLWGAYSITKLLSGYAGSALRVRRSSDNTEQDIGFSGTALDTTSLATFVGANNGFVTNWYDQSGAGNDLVQATQANQPRIVNAGTYDGKLVFDKSNDILSTTNNSGTPSAFTWFLKNTNGGSGAATMVNTEHSTNWNSNDACGWFYDPADGRVKLVSAQNVTAPTGSYQNTYAATTTQAVRAFRVDRTEATMAEQAKYFSDGTIQSIISTTGAGTIPSSNFAAKTWNLGSRVGTLPSDISVFTFLIYERAISDSEIGTIGGFIT